MKRMTLKIQIHVWIAAGLLVLSTIGCAAKERLVVHYEHIETCKTWSDFDDATPFVSPLLVFRIVSIENTSASNAASTEFATSRLYFQGDKKHFEEHVAVPSFQPLVLTFSPGQKFVFSEEDRSGLVAIQLFGESISEATLQALDPYLIYESDTNQTVQLVKDASTPNYHPFCGKTYLFGL